MLVGQLAISGVDKILLGVNVNIIRTRIAYVIE